MIRRRPVSRAAETLIGRMLFRRTALRRELVALMRHEAAALGDAAVEATDLWDGLRGELRERLSHGDPAEFLRWPPVQRTMVMRSHRRAAPELPISGPGLIGAAAGDRRFEKRRSAVPIP